MLKTAETPEQAADRCLRELRDAMRRAGRDTLSYAREIDGRVMSVTVRLPKKTIDQSADLPPDLRKARHAVRAVYRAVRDLRAERGELAAVWPSDVAEWLDARFPDDTPHAAGTVTLALADLRKLKLAWAPDPKAGGDDRGWRLGSEQNVLPIADRSGEVVPVTPPTGPAARATDGSRRASRGIVMPREMIWVPGERSEYGLLVTDAVTEEVVAVTEKVGRMRVPTRSGRATSAAAVRAELVRVEGRYAVAKLPGGRLIRTRVLGDWHLAGDAEPDADDE